MSSEADFLALELAPTRRALLLAGAAGAGGLAVALLDPASALAGSTTATSSGADGPPLTEAQHLERLVQIKLLLRYCYERVLASPVISQAARTSLHPFIAHAQQHIAALERKLRAHGGQIPPAPTSDADANRDLGHRHIAGRLGELKGEPDAVRLLLNLEQVSVGAIFVALLTIHDVDLIELCLQIMANGAQHEAVLGLLLPPHKPQNAVPYGLVQGIQSAE